MYTESELAAVAKRENNTKRNYLVINRLQGKHIPVSPKKFHKMTKELADLVRKAYPDETLLLVGFAETATAIGSALAVGLHTAYIQTTRENIDNVEWLCFTESHSHATEQKLVRDDIARVIDGVQRIVFVEDEITTGNTIMKIIDIIDREFGGTVNFSVASLLNGMDTHSYETYVQRQIGIHYLVKTEHSGYSSIAEKYAGNGIYTEKNTSVPVHSISKTTIMGARNPRRLVQGDDYAAACEVLWKQIRTQEHVLHGTRILVLGTEECMYPALYTAARMEECGFTVKCHSTTRSPIIVSEESDYPLHRRFTLASLYDKERTTYLYDIDKYDTVLIITDAKHPSSDGINSLVNALELCGNERIHLIQWKE